MSEIYFPGSLCPLHLGHEDFIETIQEKTGKGIYFSIKSGDKILEEIERGNKNGELDYLITKLKRKNEFLNLHEIYSIIQEIYPNSKIGNDTRDEIIGDDFEGIVLGSDNFNLIINSIEKGNKKSIKFKKIYLYERIGYKILEYEKLFEKKNIDVKVVLLGKGRYDVSSSTIVKEYNSGGIKKIKKFVSSDVFNLIEYIKEGKLR